jgi:uncharacterized membrane protein
MSKNKILGWILLITPIIFIISIVLYYLGFNGLIHIIGSFIVTIMFGGMMFGGLYLIDKDRLEKRKKEQNDQR